MIEIEGISFTVHARLRLFARSFNVEGVRDVLSFGREVHIRSAVIYAVGRREVEQARKHGEDISEIEGWHIVCGQSGAILTVFRNRGFCHLQRVCRMRNSRFKQQSR